MQQYGSKYFARRTLPTLSPHPLTLRMGSVGQSSTFLEPGHVAYQIKNNHKCSNTVANILPADPPPHHTNLGDGVKRSKFSFSEHSMLHIYQINENHECSNMVAYILLADPPPHNLRGWDQKVKIQLLKNTVMLHIKLKRITNAATW